MSAAKKLPPIAEPVSFALEAQGLAALLSLDRMAAEQATAAASLTEQASAQTASAEQSAAAQAPAVNPAVASKAAGQASFVPRVARQEANSAPAQVPSPLSPTGPGPAASAIPDLSDAAEVAQQTAAAAAAGRTVPSAALVEGAVAPAPAQVPRLQAVPRVRPAVASAAVPVAAPATPASSVPADTTPVLQRPSAVVHKTLPTAPPAVADVPVLRTTFSAPVVPLTQPAPPSVPQSVAQSAGASPVVVAAPAAAPPSKAAGVAKQPQAGLGRVGPYELQAELAHQGLGRVFKAWDTADGIDVAVTLLDIEADTQGRVAEMQDLQRTVLAAAALKHPGLSRIHDAGAVGDSAYIAIEWQRGRSLQLALQSGWQPTATTAASVVCDLAQTLAYVHANGVVHGGLSPSNVMLDADDRPTLMGLGYAGALNVSDLPTTEPVVNGLAPYLAPEQLHGGKLEAPVDVHALGVLLYEMLAGHRAYPGDTVADVVRSLIKHEPTPPHWQREDVPERLSAIAMQALQRNPAARFASAQDMAAALQQWLHEVDRSGPPLFGSADEALEATAGGSAVAGSLAQEPKMRPDRPAAAAAAAPALLDVGAGRSAHGFRDQLADLGAAEADLASRSAARDLDLELDVQSTLPFPAYADDESEAAAAFAEPALRDGADADDGNFDAAAARDQDSTVLAEAQRRRRGQWWTAGLLMAAATVAAIGWVDDGGRPARPGTALSAALPSPAGMAGADAGNGAGREAGSEVATIIELKPATEERLLVALPTQVVVPAVAAVAEAAASQAAAAAVAAAPLVPAALVRPVPPVSPALQTEAPGKLGSVVAAEPVTVKPTTPVAQQRPTQTPVRAAAPAPVKAANTVADGRAGPRNDRSANPTPAPVPVPTPAPVVGAQAPSGRLIAAPSGATVSSEAAGAAGRSTAAAQGLVLLAVSPWGSVELDGRSVGVAPPLNQLSLPEGRHTITLRNGEAPPFVTTIQVIAGQAVTLRHRFSQ